MLSKIFNIKKEFKNNKEIILQKKQSIDDKKVTIKGEMDKWGKKQPKKNFP